MNQPTTPNTVEDFLTRFLDHSDGRLYRFDQIRAAILADRAQRLMEWEKCVELSMAADWMQRAIKAEKELAQRTPAAPVVAEGFVWPEPPKGRQSNVLFDDGYAEGWAKAIDTVRKLLAAHPVAGSPADTCAEMRALCSACGGTGDVTSLDGEWRGACDCEASRPAAAEPMPASEAQAVEITLGNGMWHTNCSNHFGGIMKEVAQEPTRSIMKCLSCGKHGYYPVRGTGRICSTEAAAPVPASEAQAKLGRMRQAFHINMLRAYPEKSHAEISAEIDKACGTAAPVPASEAAKLPLLLETLEKADAHMIARFADKRLDIEGYRDWCIEAMGAVRGTIITLRSFAAPAAPTDAQPLTTERSALPSIMLTRDMNGMCVVSIYVNEQWVSVLRDNGDIIDHTVEPSGIKEYIFGAREPSREVTFDQAVLLAGIQCLCISADQEWCRQEGKLSEFDKGWFMGQLHIFDLYTVVEKSAIAEAREYIEKLSVAAPAAPTDARPAQCQAKLGEWSECQMRTIEAYNALQPPRQSAQSVRDAAQPIAPGKDKP